MLEFVDESSLMVHPELGAGADGGPTAATTAATPLVLAAPGRSGGRAKRRPLVAWT